MIQGLDMYQFLNLVTNLSLLATNIVVLVALFRVMNIVRHPCLPLIAFSTVLAFISAALFLVMDFVPLPNMRIDTLYLVGCACTVVSAATFAIGVWQLLHWIPELLELRALDQRDEPFKNNIP